VFSTIRNFIPFILKDNELVWQVTCMGKITNMSQFWLENTHGRDVCKDDMHVRG